MASQKENKAKKVDIKSTQKKEISPTKKNVKESKTNTITNKKTEAKKVDTTNKKTSAKELIKKNTSNSTKKVSNKVVKENEKKNDVAKERKDAAKKTTEKKESVNTKKIEDSKNVDLKVVEDRIEKKLATINETDSVNEVKINKDSKVILNFSLLEVILMIIITILVCILVGYFIIPKETKEPEKIIAGNEIDTFLEQYNYILDNYYGDIDKEQLINDAIIGMFSSLDDYSQVIDQDSNSFSITLQGEYEGVGIEITNDIYGNIVVVNVYDKTPAYKVGIQPGDMIIRFNDIDLTGKTTVELVEMIATADEMQLTILRNNEEMTMKLKREKIVLESVKSKMLENKIGYIDVDIFAANTKEQFEKALTELENKRMKSLIIDLRDNTGGHLSAVEEMLSLFLNKNHIIYQTEDKNGVEKTYSKGNKDKKYKIVILQNGLSASASEIMSAALSEELNAYIIGNTSFGKGTVQTLKDVNTDLQYKFTSKRWLTPKGNWVNGVGVKADLEVTLNEEYYQNPIFENDNQLKAAIDYLNK